MSVYLQQKSDGNYWVLDIAWEWIPVSLDLRFRDPGDPLDVIHYVHWVDIQTMSKIYPLVI